MAPSEELHTARLVLTPLEVADAAEMVGVLADAELYVFTGGAPPTLDRLEEQYRSQSAKSPHRGETWLNWIIRLDGCAIGYVQATVTGTVADLAWVIGSAWQGHGYASEAAAAMRDWLVDNDVSEFTAHIHPDHTVSHRVAVSLGLHPSEVFDQEDEEIWT